MQISNYTHVNAKIYILKTTFEKNKKTTTKTHQFIYIYIEHLTILRDIFVLIGMQRVVCVCLSVKMYVYKYCMNKTVSAANAKKKQ